MRTLFSRPSPEAQFDQTIKYLDRLATKRGRPPVKRELHWDDVDRGVRVDPDNGRGFMITDYKIRRLIDGTLRVEHEYDTTEFDPDSRTATVTHYEPGWKVGPDTEPQVSELDTDGQLNLVASIRRAVRSGRVFHDRPVYPRPTAEGFKALAAEASAVNQANSNR